MPEDITTNDQFLLKLEHYTKKWESIKRFQNKNFSNDFSNIPLRIVHLNIKDVHLSDLNFQNVKFKDCTFRSTHFMSCTFDNCDFIDCKFLDCDLSFTSFFQPLLEKCKFSGGTIAEALFSSGSFEKVSFEHLREITGARFGECGYTKVQFLNTYISHITFENKAELKERQITFSKCHISHSIFYWVNLEDWHFNECTFSVCSFNNCRIALNTFGHLSYSKDNAFSSIDFQTILKSELLEETLKVLFGVYNNDIKFYLSEMVSEVEMNTVFISYSFKNREFAKKLNNAFNARGVFTFLWENDAPGGQRLKHIMSTNISKFDKVLFISSKDSLKSEACHFELTQARMKQEKNWDVILFPIHIDNFLFTIEEHQIPLKHRTEFWKNISELREINSIDCTQILSQEISNTEFSKLIDKLVKDLRKRI